MFYNHILLEAYCTVNELKKCKLHNEHISIECFSTHCKFLSYTEAPNEIALVDKNGVAMHFIGFGGDMETTDDERCNNITKWNSICKKKIDEAYDLYMADHKKQ